MKMHVKISQIVINKHTWNSIISNNNNQIYNINNPINNQGS